MNVNSIIKSRVPVTVLWGVALATGMVVFRAQADQWDKKTVLTVNEPVQVRDKLLEPGQYVFRLLDSNSDRHIVQIYNGDQTHVIDTILAIPNYRLEPKGDSRFAFWETPPGHARALRAWFYPGDNVGQEFRYPKQLAMLETSLAAPAPEPAAAEPAPQETAPVQQAPAAEPAQPQSMNQEPHQQGEPVEIAQNTEPATQEPAPATEAAPKERVPVTLPKTSSPYPLIGLSGAFLLGIGGLLRLKRPV
jgi:nucleoid-associated protein YgaU